MKIIANDTQLQSKYGDPILSIALPLIKIGAAPLRVKPRQKAAIENGWSRAPVVSADIFATTRKTGENVGIRLGKPSKTPFGYLNALDFDVRNSGAEPDARAALLCACPNANELPSVISGSGGASRHFYIFTPDPLASWTIAKGDGWELAVKGTGTYVVAPGSIHPDTGQPYHWERHFDLTLWQLIGAPVVDLSLLRKPKLGRDPLDDLLGKPDRLPVDWTRLKSALGFVDGYHDRDTWLRIGAALHYESGGDDQGYQSWCEWSEQSAKFNSRDQARTWASFGRSRASPITAG
ncbi:bifunctional DNA primase/polymerase, partial [Puniceibacterium confluentis]|uniref:bifunctional DNA primase/polymerase n=1 Tax=Puniceibacterium confluentis TaxID=1958944 RepID=UPI003569B9FC